MEERDELFIKLERLAPSETWEQNEDEDDDKDEDGNEVRLENEDERQEAYYARLSSHQLQ